MLMTKQKELIEQEEIHECLKHNISDSDKPNQEKQQLLKLLQEMQITLDDPTLEDSLDGTRIGVTWLIIIENCKIYCIV
jgi:hypothetical protein